MKKTKKNHHTRTRTCVNAKKTRKKIKKINFLRKKDEKKNFLRKKIEKKKNF